MHYRQTTLVHLADTDTLAIERDRTGMVGATVRDATGNTVARIEFIGRLEQLNPVALAAAVVGVETETVPLTQLVGRTFKGETEVVQDWNRTPEGRFIWMWWGHDEGGWNDFPAGTLDLATGRVTVVKGEA